MSTALLDLAEQQRFVVRYARAMSERDLRLEGRVNSLESRVDRLETKYSPLRGPHAVAAP